MGFIDGETTVRLDWWRTVIGVCSDKLSFTAQAEKSKRCPVAVNKQTVLDNKPWFR